MLKSDIPITCGFFSQSQNFVIRGLKKPTGLETPFQSSLTKMINDEQKLFIPNVKT